MGKFFDIRAIRSIISGEVAGSKKLLFFLLIAIVAWMVGGYYSSLTARVGQTITIQRGRLATLGELAAQYNQMVGDKVVVNKTNAGDLVPVFSRIVEEAGLRNRLLQISPVSRGVSVQMDRLYVEDLVSLLKGMAMNGIRVVSSELRALPFEDKRLFSFFATLEVED